MPVKIIRMSYGYCMKNKLFFAFVLALLFLCQVVINYFDSFIIGSMLISLIMMGYGLHVTQDIINNGTRLPKIIPKRIIVFGIKGYIVFLFYIAIQTVLLFVVTASLNFPIVEIEDFILKFSETMHLFMVHDPVSFTLFVVSEFVIIYVTSFFMELALARLADGGKLKDAFNFIRIKHAIDVIGWKNYTIDYTKIILAIVILTHLSSYKLEIPVADDIIDFVLSFLIFVVQFMGIGYVYKAYADKKLEIDEN